MFNKLKYIIIESVFPARCVICERLGRFLCEDCLGDVLKISKQACVFCGRISDSGKLCPACRSRHYLTGICSFAYFKDDKMREIIYAFKYEDLTALKGALGELLYKTVKKEGFLFDVVTFVPISKKRKTKRGYNQSELLAKELGELSGVPVKNFLEKKKETKTQVGLKRKERVKNLKGSFVPVGNCDLKGKKVLIIDDVVTTGATLDECAKELRRAGASRVWGLTLAKE